MKITFFETPADLRRWFREHAHAADELWVGFGWVINAKQEATRMKRFDTLVAAAAAGKRLW
jgi:hypothetical protein